MFLNNEQSNQASFYPVEKKKKISQYRTLHNTYITSLRKNGFTQNGEKTKNTIARTAKQYTHVRARTHMENFAQQPAHSSKEVGQKTWLTYLAFSLIQPTIEGRLYSRTNR